MKFWLWVILVIGLTFQTVGYASNFPQKVTLVLKQKISCRDAKRLVRKHRLFVSCEESSPFNRAYQAIYLGKEPLTNVLGRVANYAKIEAAAVYGDVSFSN